LELDRPQHGRCLWYIPEVFSVTLLCFHYPQEKFGTRFTNVTGISDLLLGKETG
jgi:hypothetical protein